MTPQRCGAQLELGEGTGPAAYATCDRWVDGHQFADHRDSGKGVEWPACSQHCLKAHVHGRYRIKMGTPPPPKPARPRAPKQKRCNACLSAERNLDKYGVCVDRAACEAAAPPLFPSAEVSLREREAVQEVPA